MLAPRTYAFMYRLYVNFEDAGTIKRALWHVPTLLVFFSADRGTWWRPNASKDIQRDLQGWKDKLRMQDNSSKVRINQKLDGAGDDYFKK